MKFLAQSMRCGPHGRLALGFMTLRPILCIALALSTPTLARASSAWEQYDALLARQCPSRHVDLLVDGQYPDFLASFEHGLSPALRHKVAIYPNTLHRCAGEQFGFSCETARSLEAYRRLNLMHRFVAYSCRNVRCEDMGICSQFPKAAP